MAIALLALIERIRQRLDDIPDTSTPGHHYAAWQVDDSPNLWKNLELIALLKRALLETAARAPWIDEGVTADEVGDPCRLSVTGYDPEVALHVSTLAVDQARLVSSGLLLEKTESGRLAATQGVDWTELTGTPTHYLDVRRGRIRLFPIPVIDDELRLVVRRRCLAEFDWIDIADEATPTFTLDDVPDDLEEALIVGTCQLAFLKRDADTFNLDLSREYERQLTALVGPQVSWRVQEARRQNANLETAIRPYSYFGGQRFQEDWQ